MATSQRDLLQQQLERRVRAAWEARNYHAGATTLLEEIGPKVLAFLLGRLKNPADTAEAFSMFSEDLWRGLPNFDWRCTVRGWSFLLARTAADRLRAQGWRRKPKVPLSQAPLSSLVAEVREQTLPHLRTEAKGQMRLLFEELCEDDQALLQLRLDQALSWRDVALVLEFDGKVPSELELERSVLRLQQRYQKIKRRLRQLAEATGLVCAGDKGQTGERNEDGE
jgi:RNA polymerase sigma-70 factor (ECF subfamily)